jgi:two-component sensor histidine kinase
MIMGEDQRPLFSRTPTADLLSAVEALARAGSSEEVVDIVRKTARRLIGSDGIALVIRDGEACHYIEEDAIGPLWKGSKFPMSECISGWVMQNGRTAAIPDVFKDDRIPSFLYHRTFVRSLVMAPAGSEHSIGALGAYWAQVYEPTRYEIETVETLARAVATALEHARLIAALSRALSQAELARDELLHRVKNAYLAAKSLAMMSLPPDYSKVFSARITALARAHELIDRKMSHQVSISVGELLQAELEPYNHDVPGRLNLDGPMILLDSAQAVALGLAVNELATNALKHGALATVRGRLDVRWRLEGNHLILEWREADGPEVRTSALESFGSRLLRRLIEGQLRGSLLRRMEKDGVSCLLEFPISTVGAEPPANTSSQDSSE